MNEWILASGAVMLVLTLTGFIFGWGWRIISDVKKSAHARIDRLETRMHECDKICNARKNNVNEILESKFSQLRGEMTTGFSNLGGRIDGLILTLNGRGKRDA